MAFAELDVFSPGVVKGIILRHLRWWLAQPIFDRDGILTLGFAYPNLAMCEDYNSPGSPYWALKVFLIMALPEDHAFWQAEELPLPELAPVHAIVPAQQILQHCENSQHVVMLTSGQLELNNYVNTEAKYTKFAYSTRFGFTIERGRYGIKHAACDSMLLLSDNDNYWRGRRECESVEMLNGAIYSRWLPWHDVQIDTWLIPCGEWHVRVHYVNSARRLQTVEGGFAVMKADADITTRCSKVQAANGQSVIMDLSPYTVRQADSVITPPNSSVMFAECASIPTLVGEMAPGDHWLCCAVTASGHSVPAPLLAPTLVIENNMLHVTDNVSGETISLHL